MCPRQDRAGGFALARECVRKDDKTSENLPGDSDYHGYGGCSSDGLYNTIFSTAEGKEMHRDLQMQAGPAHSGVS